MAYSAANYSMPTTTQAGYTGNASSAAPSYTTGGTGTGYSYTTPNLNQYYQQYASDPARQMQYDYANTMGQNYNDLWSNYMQGMPNFGGGSGTNSVGWRWGYPDINNAQTQSDIANFMRYRQGATTQLLGQMPMTGIARGGLNVAGADANPQLSAQRSVIQQAAGQQTANFDAAMNYLQGLYGQQYGAWKDLGSQAINVAGLWNQGIGNANQSAQWLASNQADAAKTQAQLQMQQALQAQQMQIAQQQADQQAQDWQLQYGIHSQYDPLNAANTYDQMIRAQNKATADAQAAAIKAQQDAYSAQQFWNTSNQGMSSPQDMAGYRALQQTGAKSAWMR